MGSDREKLFEQRGAPLPGAEGETFEVGQRIQIYMAAPNDAMDFWIQSTDPTDTFSKEAIDGLFEEMKRFFMTRLLRRLEAGHPPSKALVDLSMRFEPEMPEPEAMGVDTFHRSRLRPD